jgi:protein TonB
MIWLSAAVLIVQADKPADVSADPATGAVVPPKRIPGTFMTDSDYPKEAFKLHQEGMVVAQVHVDATGKVRSCTIQQSVGSPSLDKATCAVARTRRYLPARDAAGKAVAADAPVQVNWRLPAS